MKGKRIEETRRPNPSSPMPTAFRKRHIRWVCVGLCLLSLTLSVLVCVLVVEKNLRETCASVSEEFKSIMTSYRHSFGLLEKYLQLEIETARDADEIEAFLKAQDAELLAIEGGEYDGVYMYHQGRYLYSWDTPQSVYEESGYDATKRPWYIGAMEAKGEIFFSVPYPSYANDYMLATLSRLQADGQTIIAYDIKLGEIGKYVERLNIYNDSLTLICDEAGNILASTEPLYQGGNVLRTDADLTGDEQAAQQALNAASDEKEKAKALRSVQSAAALRDFVGGSREDLSRLLAGESALGFNARKGLLEYAYPNAAYTCMVLLPLLHLLPMLAVLWAAISFVLMLLAAGVMGLLRSRDQIVKDVLTGLNNRRAFMNYCLNHLAHHPDSELCLIMLDLNDFKSINDRYGHVAGDRALLDAASALKRTCAQAPCHLFLCRYGGDEFLLAGINCTQADVEKTIALVKTNLRKANERGTEPYTLEISCGVSQGRGSDESDIEALLAMADSAMYEDKLREKKNRATENGKEEFA